MALLTAGVPRGGKGASMVLRTSGSDLRRSGSLEKGSRNVGSGGGSNLDQEGRELVAT